MEKLRKFETEEQYLNEKETLEYPCVSLTADNEKVWIKEKQISYIVAKYNIKENNLTPIIFINNNYDFNHMIDYYVTDEGVKVEHYENLSDGINQKCKFNTPGEHTVTFYMKDILPNSETNYSEGVGMDSAFFYSDIITEIDFSNFLGSSQITSMYCTFSDCYSLTSITFGDKWDSSNITNINRIIGCLNSNVIKDFDNFYQTLNITNDNGEKLSEDDILDLMLECWV